MSKDTLLYKYCKLAAFLKKIVIRQYVEIFSVANYVFFPFFLQG